MGQFADIRPYNDNEVEDVIKRLLADDEFIASIGRLRLGSKWQSTSWLMRPVIRWILGRELKHVDTVVDFQHLVKRYMDKMVASTTRRFTVSGLDSLNPEQPYLFISNHRDIALDPAFVNFALYCNGHDTVRIAIGDNLLTKPFVSDLMRLNKSFIVNRSAKGPRQMLAAYRLLSTYIRHSIEQDNNSIWIAQREGRAKDGIDLTEPAIIKMLAMSQDKSSESFADYINKLHIVPVAISYEFDPCDGAKARELYEISVHGHYEKSEHEDVSSIARGIAGYKGHVHVAFGTPLSGDFDDADAVAGAIDQQIIANYLLHPTNFFAYKQLRGEYPAGCYTHDNKPFDPDDFGQQEQQFQERMAALPAEHRAYALGIYANAITQKQQLK